MSLSLSRFPTLFSLAGNPVYFSINSDDIANDFYRICLQIYSGDELISEDSIEPDVDRISNFDIETYLKSLFINYHFEYRLTDIIRKTDFVKSYFVKYYEVYWENDIKQESEKVSSSVFYVLNGKLLELHDNNYRLINGSYYVDLMDKMLFLTFQPRTKKIDVNQIERLYFLNWNDNISTININVEIYYSDNTISTFLADSILSETKEIYEISTGYQELVLSEYESQNNLIIKYKVWLTAQDNSIISECFNYEIDRKKNVYTRYFVFQNRVGGFDTVRCTGIQTIENELEHQIGYSFLGKLKTGSNSTMKHFANTGLIDTVYNYYLQEFFESMNVIEICGEGIFNVTIENKKTEVRQENKFLYEQIFEYTRDLIIELFTTDNEMTQLYGDYSFLDYSSDYNI